MDFQAFCQLAILYIFLSTLVFFVVLAILLDNVKKLEKEIAEQRCSRLRMKTRLSYSLAAYKKAKDKFIRLSEMTRGRLSHQEIVDLDFEDSREAMEIDNDISCIMDYNDFIIKNIEGKIPEVLKY